jgi:hypothetical protein
VKYHPFPIPKIGKSDMIRPMVGFTFASALDLNMGYYHIKLDHDADDQSYVQLYSNGIRENTNTNAYSWYQG